MINYYFSLNKRFLSKTLSLLVCLSILGINAGKAQALTFLNSVTAVFDSSTNNLIRYTVFVEVGGTAASAVPLPAGTKVQLTYSDGTKLPATIGPTPGLLLVPPPPIPAGVTSLGNSVVITPPLGTDSKPIKWRDRTWVGVKPEIVIDPLGLPGFTPNQSWFIDISEEAPEFSDGSKTSTVVDSNFDLEYQDIGGGLFEATIVGDNSFIRFADDTYVAFPDNIPFGEIQFLFNDGITANGTFDFFAIGLAGVWEWLNETNYTGATSTANSPFNAPEITIATTSESSPMLGLLVVGAFAGTSILFTKRQTH